MYVYLWRSPANWHEGIVRYRLNVEGIVRKVRAHPEVGYLDDLSIPHETTPRCDITVGTLHRVNVIQTLLRIQKL